MQLGVSKSTPLRRTSRFVLYVLLLQLSSIVCRAICKSYPCSLKQLLANIFAVVSFLYFSRHPYVRLRRQSDRITWMNNLGLFFFSSFFFNVFVGEKEKNRSSTIVHPASLFLAFASARFSESSWVSREIALPCVRPLMSSRERKDLWFCPPFLYFPHHPLHFFLSSSVSFTHTSTHCTWFVCK